MIQFIFPTYLKYLKAINKIFTQGNKHVTVGNNSQKHKENLNFWFTFLIMREISLKGGGPFLALMSCAYEKLKAGLIQVGFAKARSIEGRLHLTASHAFDMAVSSVKDLIIMPT